MKLNPRDRGSWRQIHMLTAYYESFFGTSHQQRLTQQQLLTDKHLLTTLE